MSKKNSRLYNLNADQNACQVHEADTLHAIIVHVFIANSDLLHSLK